MFREKAEELIGAENKEDGFEALVSSLNHPIKEVSAHPIKEVSARRLYAEDNLEYEIRLYFEEYGGLVHGKDLVKLDAQDEVQFVDFVAPPFSHEPYFAVVV